MLACRRWLEADEDARNKRTHELAVLGRTELDDGLHCTRSQRVFQLFAEHHGVGWDRPLLLDRARAGDDFIVKLLGHVAGDHCRIDLALLERLPALTVAAAEQDFLEIGF